MGFGISGQPGRTDVGPGWLQLGACNIRSSLGVSNAFTVVQKIALTAIVDQAGEGYWGDLPPAQARARVFVRAIWPPALGPASDDVFDIVPRGLSS